MGPKPGDWSNDRHGDGWLPVMNISVASWRNVLRDRIDRVITDYEVDSYFMDIAGLRENNPKADIYVGTQQLMADLAQQTQVCASTLVGSKPLPLASGASRYAFGVVCSARNSEGDNW